MADDSSSLMSRTLSIRTDDTAISYSTKFELNYLPINDRNPVVAVYCPTKSNLQSEDDLPSSDLPSYEDIQPAYFLKFDPRTWGTYITAARDDSRVATVSFAKTKAPVIKAEEATGEESTTMKSHLLIPSRSTSFVTSRGCFQWSRSPSSTASFNNGNESSTTGLRLYRIPSKNHKSNMNTNGDRYQVVGKMGVSKSDPSTMVLEMDGDAISEAMFLGTALAMLRKSDLRVSSMRKMKGSVMKMPPVAETPRYAYV